MIEHGIYDVIGRSLAKLKNDGDDEILANWLEESEDHRFIYEELSKAWHDDNAANHKVIGAEEVKENLLKTIRSNKKVNSGKQVRIFSLKPLRYAAAILILLTTFFALYNYAPQKSETASDIKTLMTVKENVSGRKSVIHLKDGSIVSLNAESSLTYPEQFSDTARLIFLTGEAYFDVAPDPLKPFRVICGDVEVEALGTSFNINSSEKDVINVSLISGKVQVTNVIQNTNEGQNNTILNPGQQLTYYTNRKEFGKVKSFDENQVIGWKDGVLQFNKADIETLVRQLERWYGVDIEIQSKNPKNTIMQYTGKFKNENLQNVLESIGFVQQFNYEIKDNKVTLFFND